MAGELILIVEDNPNNLKLMRDVLQLRGYTTLEAETGEAGVTLALARQPALILMDVQLPGMDGSTAMKALKANPSTQIQIEVVPWDTLLQKLTTDISGGANADIAIIATRWLVDFVKQGVAEPLDVGIARDVGERQHDPGVRVGEKRGRDAMSPRFLRRK